MPTLPTYDSTRKISSDLNTQPRAIIRNDAGQTEAITSKTLGVVQEGLMKWQGAVDTIQYTAAKANYETGMADILSRASQDPDYNGSDKYYKEIDKVNKESIKGIQNKGLAQRVGMEFGADSQVSKIKVGNLFRNKMIEYTRGVTLPESIDALTKKRINATGEEFAKISNEIKILVNDNIQKGILSADEGKKLLDDAEYTAAQYEIYQNPDQGKADIKAGLYNLNPKQEEDLLEKADHIKQHNEELIKWNIKQVNTEGAFSLAQLVQNKTLNIDAINSLFKTGQIDSKTAAVFTAALDKDYTPPDTTQLYKPDFFLQLLDKSLDNKTESLEILKQATTAYGKGDIQENQYAYFISEAKKRFDKYKGGQPQKDNVLSNAVNSVRDFSSLANPIKTANLVTDFLRRIVGGAKPEEAKKEVIEQELNNQIEESKLTIPPQTVKVISPEGKPGYIPLKNLDKALEKGYKRAD
uniref:Uncharacterized protein n=1 Tax=viral metagenome TaxID=1070528 RepID=A0A6M3K7K3_9ZZZZ